MALGSVPWTAKALRCCLAGHLPSTAYPRGAISGVHARLEETVAIKIEVAAKSLLTAVKAHALRECH